MWVCRRHLATQNAVYRGFTNTTRRYFVGVGCGGAALPRIMFTHNESSFRPARWIFSAFRQVRRLTSTRFNVFHNVLFIYISVKQERASIKKNEKMKILLEDLKKKIKKKNEENSSIELHFKPLGRQLLLVFEAFGLVKSWVKTITIGTLEERNAYLLKNWMIDS